MKVVFMLAAVAAFTAAPSAASIDSTGKWTGPPVRVHIVPHTHDDVGWLKTVDEYYSGANNSIQHAGVRYIITTAIDELAKNPSRKFTYVEQAFFQRWYREQTPEKKALTKKLVASGQLSFVNGGWCMHDEAAVHYMGMIDQTTTGHKLLLDEFGKDGIPTVAWQLDPFGHSATQAALLSAEAGMDALFFGRIDYQDLKLRVDESRAEFIWRASPSLGPDAQVFAGLTGEYGGNYGPPNGFNWGHDSNDEPIEDNKNLSSYNVPARVNQFVTEALWQADHTRGTKTREVMMTFGTDFQYENADEWFMNLDKLIKATNTDGRVEVFYSTPAEYVAAKRADTETNWTLVDGDNADFFPYADGPHKFWTGYFTSRPALKRYIRRGSAIFSAIRQADALANAGTGNTAASAVNAAALELFEEALGVVQHHDAVSGTAKQHTSFDYAKRVSIGEAAAEEVLSRSIDALVTKHQHDGGNGGGGGGGAGSRGRRGGAGGGGGGGGGAAVPVVVSKSKKSGGWEICRRLNESVCAATSGVGTVEAAASPVAFKVWNQLGQERKTQLVMLPVATPPKGTSIVVTDSRTGKAVTSQLLPAAEEVTNYKRNVAGGVGSAVAFQAALPAVGAASYVLSTTTTTTTASTPSAAGDASKASVVTRPTAGATAADTVMENDLVKLTFSGATGRLASWVNKAAGNLEVKVVQDFCFYESSSGNEHSLQASGAYIFRPIPAPGAPPSAQAPCHPVRELFAKSTLITSVVQGGVVQEVRQQFAPWLTQTVRLGAGDRFATFEYTVGAIPLFGLAAEPAGGINNHSHAVHLNAPGKLTGIGKEVVSTFTTDIASAGEVWTDSNGREMLHRKRDFRPTWHLNQTESVAGNYFPCNAAAAIRDTKAQLTVLVDASQGTASLVDGKLEMMVHRRITHDDGRGVGEPLDETQFVTDYTGDKHIHGEHYGPGLVIRGKHTVSLEPPATAASVWRPLADSVYAEPLITFAAGASRVSDALHRHQRNRGGAFGASALSAPLPANVQLISFQQVGDGTTTDTVLIRLAHQFGIDEDAILSQPVTVDLAQLFNASTAFKITNAVEYSLTANQPKAEIMRKRKQAREWHNDGVESHPWRLLAPLDYAADTTVVLGPLEIKTFLLTVSK